MAGIYAFKPLVEPLISECDYIHEYWDAKTSSTKYSYQDGMYAHSFEVSDEMAWGLIGTSYDIKKFVLQLISIEKQKFIASYGGLETVQKLNYAGSYKSKKSNSIRGWEVTELLERIFPNFPWDDEIKCPVCVDPKSGRSIIQHLNDYHMWAREQIADWLEEQDFDILSDIRKDDVHDNA